MRPFANLRLGLALAALAALTALGWWLPARPVAVATPGGIVNSVSFAPFRPGESPLTETFPTAAEVDADLALLAGKARAIRTYASVEGDYDTAALAEAHGLKLWLGVWLGADRAKNEAEVAAGIRIARAHPGTVERLVVGNEVLLRRDLPPDELAADIDRVRAAVAQPVTYADVWEFWEQFPEMAAHVDIVTIHLLPYWEDDPVGIDGAVDHVGEVHRRVAALFPGKPVAIGETGWPSGGRQRRDAAPGRVNEALFIARFATLAQRERFDYNLIEAFDQDWKSADEGTVGARWGIGTSARSPKFPDPGRVSEDPGWPAKALAAVALAVALLAGAARSRASLPLAVLSFGLANAFVYAWTATLPVAFSPPERIAAAGNLAGQALLGVLLLRRAARRLAGGRPEAHRTGADATRTLRRLRLPPMEGVFDDLSFLFLWAAAVLQLLLLFDPRYRDFPLPSFAVPLVAVAARACLRDLPADGGGREELAAGGTLAVCAIASAVMEGPLNGQSLVWNAAALALAAPPLLRLRAGRRPGRLSAPAPAPAGR